MPLKFSFRALFVVLAVLGITQRCDAVQNLLNNGNFAVGSGDSVDGWRHEAWMQDEGTTDYHWIPRVRGQAGEVELISHRDNDARWQQPLSLAPGWYYISADARTHGVLNFAIGANVSVLDSGIMSEELKGDTDWRRLGFYLKIGPQGADVDVCLRLGGFGSLTRGEAFFRDARVEKVTEPPAGPVRVFDLTEIRKAQIAPPVGRPWTLFATFFFLGLVGALGWWLMSEPVPGATAPAPPVAAPPSAKRRKSSGAR